MSDKNELPNFLENACFLSADKVNLVIGRCETLKIFLEQCGNWKDLYDFSFEEFKRCTECLAFYKISLRDCALYADLCANYNDVHNFTAFFAYYQEKTPALIQPERTVAEHIYKLAFFERNLEYGDFILLPKKRLAVYVGK